MAAANKPSDKPGKAGETTVALQLSKAIVLEMKVLSTPEPIEHYPKAKYGK